MAQNDADWRRGEKPKRHPMLGLWAAALFNLCAVILPFAAADAIRIVEAHRLYTYEPNIGAARQSRQALERIAHRFSRSAEAQRRWDDAVARALVDGDIAAARGFMLVAKDMLPGPEAGKLRGALRGRSDDAALEAAALPFLSRSVRARYQATVPLLSRSGGAQWNAWRQARGSFVIMGDAAEFEAQARAVLANRTDAHLPLVLTGLGATLEERTAQSARVGVSVLQAGLEDNVLSPDFLAALGALADKAAPQLRFAAEARRLAGVNEPQGPVLFSAFRASLNPSELARFNGALAEIGEMARAASAPGALALLRHAHSLEDVKRLRLLAQTNPERALALARITPARIPLAAAGRGALALTPQLLAPLSATALCILLMALATLTTCIHAASGVLERQRLYFRPREPAMAPPRTKLLKQIGGR